ncbi:translocation/assembly module TamB domain-containing protein [Haemophilus haemolyticus]|uniref:Tubulin-binding protein n=1 Tax=Haemophilus haemolyticus TaxID=726 RepID=A0A0M3G680_HAEHA|nr:translocation/assembly module TamB domain-containing protein [Haemophilus haemolyticus]KKZ58257.1 tubulin-binding protein [Haemophilus haemolyticus]
MTEQKQPSETSPKSPEQPNKKHWVRKAVCIGSAVILVPILGVAGALSFDAGQRGLIQLADKMLDSFSVEQIEGGLQNGLVLNNVRYQTAGIDTHIAQARLQLDFGCLLSREVCLRDFTLNKPTIAINTALLPPSTPDDSKSGPMKRISLPIGINAENLAVQDLSVNIDQTNLTLSHFKSAVSLNNEKGLTLAPTEINDISVISKKLPEVKSEPQAEQPNKPVDWDTIEQSLTPAFLGNVSEIILPFDLHIPAIKGKNWHYQAVNEKGETLQSIEIPSLIAQADTVDNQLQLQKLAVESSLGNLYSQGKLQLDGDMPLDLTLKSHLEPLKSDGKEILSASDVDLTLSGSLKKSTALSLKIKGVLDAELNGEVQLAQDKMPLNLTLNVAKGQYAFVNTMAPLKINDVTLKLTGDLLNYHAELKGGVDGMDYIPASKVDFNADGKLYEVTVNKFGIASLDGKSEFVGTANWKEGANWDIQADLEKMNIGFYVPVMPATLSGKLHSRGFAGSQGWQVEVPVADLNGTLSSNPISLKGSATLNQNVLLTVPDLQVRYGENHLNARGVLDDHSDFVLDVDAPNLRGLWSDLSGNVKGHAAISGQFTSPNLDLDLTSSNLHLQGFQLSKASAKGNIKSDPLAKGQFNIKAEQLHYGESVKLRLLDLALSGDEQNHLLTLKSQGEPVAANLQINGHFDRILEQWKGTLSQAKFDTPIGDVKSNQAIAVSYDNKQAQANIAAHCWQNTDVELCFPQAFNVGKQGNIPFQFKRVNLDLVNKLIEQDSLKGNLQAQGNVAWFTDKPFQFTAKVDGNHLAFSQKLDYRTFKLDIPKLTLNADIQNNNLVLKTDINVHNQGRIVGDIHLNDLAKNRQLGGTLAIERLNLSIANQLLTSGESVNGEVVSKLSFGGNLEKPLLNGNFNIRNIRTKLKSMPVNITDGDIAVHFHGNNSTLQGKIETIDSRLNLTGRANWANIEHWTTELNAQANNFNVDIPSMAKLRFSPNITVKANPKELNLSGTVDIPWARIRIDSLPDTAEPVSEDEVILNGPHKSKEELIKREFAAKTKSGMDIRSDLRINIGKDVSLDAYGLKTNLDGLLSVKQDKGNLGLFGQINLTKGRYASFGQDLLIRKGLISFSGQATQPTLNIEAIRNPEAMEDSKITAGVRVIGIADSPEVTIFSEPSKPQDQALSYLLTGRSLENSGEAGSSGSVGAALLGLGLSKSGKLVGSIGEAFGIQDLNLGTSGVGDKSKLTVSGNLTNRLQIKYGVGLFDGLAEVTLRYRLMPQLYFQSVSSTNQVFDLLYQFEF